MTNSKRIRVFLAGILVILTGIILMLVPDLGYYIVLLILAFTLIVKGIGTIIYYFTMARFMIGGKKALYQGAILLDFGLLTLSMDNVPRIYFLIYLVVLYMFSGVTDILHANENRKTGARSWKFLFAQGIINLLIPIVCIAFAGTPDIAVMVYGAGLVVSGIGRIITSFRKTSFVYVQ